MNKLIICATAVLATIFIGCEKPEPLILESEPYIVELRVESGDWVYTAYSDGTAEMRQYTGDATNLMIPEQIDGYTVTSIGEFFPNSGVDPVSVTIPDTVTRIGYRAFDYCKNLGEVHIPPSVVSFGFGVFRRTPFLDNFEGEFIIINDVLIYYKDSGQTEAIVPKGVKIIGEGAFARSVYIGDFNTTLERVVLPKGLEEIGSYAFYSCNRLTDINIPKSVTRFGSDAFRGTPFIKNRDEEFVIFNGVLIKYNEQSHNAAFIPKNVRAIASGAFFECENLLQIILPEGLEEIGDNAFFNCRKLTSINIPKSVRNIGEGVFINCESLTEFAIPEWMTVIKNSMFDGCSSLVSVSIPDTVKTIGNRAFGGCWALEAVDIPAGVRYIGPGAFSACISLKSITIPEGVTAIHSSAFRSCQRFTEIVIPEGVKSVDYIAFGGCTELRSVTFPESLEEIGGWAFKDCAELTDVRLPAGLKTIAESAFLGCPPVDIPEGVEIIPPRHGYDK